MHRIAEHRGDGAGFDHRAVLHHQDAVADLRGHAQIVGDEQDRQAEPGAQARAARPGQWIVTMPIYEQARARLS